MVKHVWFDMGGTLYKETPEFKAVHDKHLYATYARLVGEQHIAKAKLDYDALYKQYGSNSAVFRSLGMPSDFWHKAFDELDVSSLLSPDFDTISTLKAIKKTLPISLFTNIKPNTIKNVLAHLQIPITDFTYIISGDDIKERKPNLEGFHKMVELTNLPPDEIMYVGDRIDVDIKPAKAVGMKTCLVWSSSDEADHSAGTFSELKDILANASLL